MYSAAPPLPSISCSKSRIAPSPSVAEQDARRAIGVIEDARHHVGADHERVLVRACRHQLAGGRQRIGERGTGSADVEAPRVVSADLVLNQASRAREHHVGGDGADHDDADVVGRETRPRDGRDRGFPAEIRRRDPRPRDVALANADALHDPLVGRVEHLLEIGIGQDSRRHVRRQRDNRRRSSAGARRLADTG
jgi:hypothetical protein